MQTASNLIDITFNKLVLWDGNVRKTGIESGLDELAASIAAHGLLNPLLVRKAAKGKFAIIAGQRRYLALRRLADAGNIGKTAAVSCHLREDGQDDSELSLAENVVRIAMHPADQFAAWRDLIEKGADVGDIAARFGVAESTVRKRLALARVSPRILALYREGALDLEALQAFTVTDDHELQERVWDGLAEWQRDNPRSIREALTESDVPSHDRRVRFVGLEAYEAAGGAVRRDLFEPEDGGFVQDVALLETLARRKLEAIADEVKEEGWNWTEARLSFGWDEQKAFVCGEPIEATLSEDMQAETQQLQAEYETLRGSDHDDDHGDDDGDHGEAGADEEAETRMQAIEERLDEIDAMTRVWPDESKARAGAIVYLSHEGKAEIERGLIRPEDADRHDDEEDQHEAKDADTVSERSAFPASLIEDLTAQKTAALRIETARSPGVALALAVHALAMDVFYRYGDTILKLRLTQHGLRPAIREHESCPALLALETERERIAAMLPEDQTALWSWCLNAGQGELLDVLAVAVAFGIDAVESKSDSNGGGREHGNALAAALNLNMADWYRPTAAGYFGRIGKAAIISDLESMRQSPAAPAWFKMKKAELAALAEREAAQAGWLPVLLQ
jgi:ParB family transcriptional regulator, chromosome partitioning protein